MEAITPPALFLTRRPLSWNHFLARLKPLSVFSSKMAAEHSKDYSSLAQPNTPALQAKFFSSEIHWSFPIARRKLLILLKFRTVSRSQQLTTFNSNWAPDEAKAKIMFNSYIY